jgi:hypothetical protein
VLWLAAPAIFLTKIFESVTKAKDINLEVPGEFIVPAELYPRILGSKKLTKYIKQIEQQVRTDIPGFKVISTEIKDNGFRYRKEGNMYKITIELQGDYGS